MDEGPQRSTSTELNLEESQCENPADSTGYAEVCEEEWFKTHGWSGRGGIQPLATCRLLWVKASYTVKVAPLCPRGGEPRPCFSQRLSWCNLGSDYSWRNGSEAESGHLDIFQAGNSCQFCTYHLRVKSESQDRKGNLINTFSLITLLRLSSWSLISQGYDSWWCVYEITQYCRMIILQ